MEGGDFQKVFEYLTYGTGTRENKRLPAPAAVPAIPARSGSQAPFVQQQSSGGSSDMTLAGVKVFTSTDGLITMTFPESAEVVVGVTTITIPAIIKTP